MIKYLVRDKKSFLEAKVVEDKIIPTEIEVNPRDLIHFGTETIDELGIEIHANKMESLGVDYLFVAEAHERVSYRQYGMPLRGGWDNSKELITVTAYLKK